MNHARKAMPATTKPNTTPDAVPIRDAATSLGSDASAAPPCICGTPEFGRGGNGRWKQGKVSSPHFVVDAITHLQCKARKYILGVNQCISPPKRELLQIGPQFIWRYQTKLH